MSMKNRNMGIRIIASIVLVAIVALVVILPLVAHAIPVWGGNPRYSGGAPPPPPSNTGSSSGSSNSNSNNGPSTQTIKQSKTVTLTNTTTTYTITKTYTQVVTQTYVVNHYIYEYMYPIIKWVFTLVNIGSQQAPGYHSVGSEELFLPGFGGGSGIFVPVYAQEAIYTLNIAPSTKPVITGWYVGRTSESSSPPSLASQSVDTYLSGIQETVNTIQNQYKVTLTNTTTYVYNNNNNNNNNSGGTTGTNKTGPTPSPGGNQSDTWIAPESWSIFWKAGPFGKIVWRGPGGIEVSNNWTLPVRTWPKPPYPISLPPGIPISPPPIGIPPINLPPGLLPPGVNSPPGFHNKFIHSGALAGVPINGAPPSIPISGLGGVLGSVVNTILNGVENGLKWLHL